MAGLGDWLTQTKFRLHRNHAHAKLDVTDLLIPPVRQCINESFASKLEYGVAIGADDAAKPVSFHASKIIKGADAHVSIPLAVAPKIPVGTFHTHPTPIGELVGGHSCADLAFFRNNASCIFMLVTEIAYQRSGRPRVVHHLVIRGDGASLPAAFATIHDTVYENTQRAAAKALPAGRAGDEQAMRLSAQSEALSFLTTKNGFMYYKGKDHETVLHLQ